MIDQIPFLIGVPLDPPPPLSRYLPLLPGSIIEQWLSQLDLKPKRGKWILDPFGSSPNLVVETARSGYRILVTANNPINRFLMEMAAIPPSTSDFQSGLAALASSTRGSERLESHIRRIYRIHCLECNADVEVDAFLWEKNSSVPYASIYECKECSFQGERDLPLEIAEKVTEFSNSGLHRSRALERVAAMDDPDRIYVEEALAVYSPRAIYVLFILINKIDSLHLSNDQRRALQALVLSACDSGNAMWGYPVQRDRPRQLFIPTRYRENNIWKVMEQAIERWTNTSSLLPVTIWPELPDENGGICIYEGPLRELAHDEHSDDHLFPEFKAVLAAVPRPNQAFWTLSALWSGWLWGREAVGPFKSVLRRRRYDWAWLNSALLAAFGNLNELVEDGTPILGLIGEAEAGLLTATMNAAFRSGLRLTGFALRDEQAQINWILGQPISETGDFKLEKMADMSIRDFLINYGQPAQFLKVWSSGLVGLFSGEGKWDQQEPESTPAEFGFNETTSLLREVLTYRGGFLRFGSGESLESSLWWLKQEPIYEDESKRLSLVDKVEMAVVNHLVKNDPIEKDKIERFLIYEFPGILTPGAEWIQVILDSYAVEQTNRSDWFSLRTEDHPSSRHKDLESTLENMEILAKKLGYKQSGESPVVWTQDGINCFYFYLTASAILSNIILKNEFTRETPAHKSLVVLPGGRANLVVYKLRLDPRLNRLCSPNEQTQQPGWRFLKIRHLRWLLDNATPLQNFEDLLSLDPLTFSAPQTRFM